MSRRTVNAKGAVDPLCEFAVNTMKSLTVALIFAGVPYGWMIYVATQDVGNWFIAALFWIVLMTFLLVTVWMTFLRHEDKILMLIERYD